MKRRDFLRFAGCVIASRITSVSEGAEGPARKRPNVLLITTDDMSCDSVGVFGCKVADTTPVLDRLAGEGIRFTYAHVQAANCVPSRNVMQTGRYPHSSGVEEFYDYENDPDALRNLIDDPQCKQEIERHRGILERWMTQTNDHCLEAFRNRRDPQAVEAYVRRMEEASQRRTSTVQKTRKGKKKKA